MDLIMVNTNSKKIEDIARTFLSQNYSIVRIEKSRLVNQTWTVEVLVSSFDKQVVKKIKISDKTGSIIEVE